MDFEYEVGSLFRWSNEIPHATLLIESQGIATLTGEEGNVIVVLKPSDGGFGLTKDCFEPCREGLKKERSLLYESFLD